MILNNRSTRRFAKLYSSFLTYANGRLNISDRLFNHFGEADPKEAYQVAKAVWTRGQNASLVADYVRDNPDRMSRFDLKEVARWEDGLLAIFTILRDGRDVLFNIDNYSIAVRGLQYEVDDVIDTNRHTLFSTVLVPFENVVVFTASIEAIEILESERYRFEPLFDLKTVKDNNRIIRSARDFLKHADALKASAASPLFDNDTQDIGPDDLDHTQGTDDGIPGQHKGALAGLTGKDRIAARERMAKEHRDEKIGTLFDFYLKITPEKEQPRSLREVYASAERDELAEIAYEMKVKGDIQSMGKNELVDAIVTKRTPDTDDVLGILRQYGPASLAYARELQEAGGRIEFGKEDAIERGEIWEVAVPVYGYFVRGDKLVAFMLDDYVSCLANVDWEAEIVRAKKLEEARHFFETVVDLRGVDYVEDAIDEFYEYIGGKNNTCDPDDIEDMVWNNSSYGVARFATATIYDTEYLVNEAFCDISTRRVDEAAVLDIIVAQAGMPKRLITPDILEYRTYTDWMQQIAEVQALVTYLDEHVPNALKDWEFADDLVSRLHASAQKPGVTPQSSPYLKAYGCYTSPEQTERLASLLESALGQLPQWSGCGWTPREMEMIRKAYKV